MQVKVSYTSELEDVPDEVALITQGLSSDIERFETLMREAYKDLRAGEVSLGKMKLKTGMTKLQKMFARLTDCQVILDGYEKVKNPQEQEQKPSSQP
jgi:hypothetical protein